MGLSGAAILFLVIMKFCSDMELRLNYASGIVKPGTILILNNLAGELLWDSHYVGIK